VDKTIRRYLQRATDMIGPSGLSSKSRICLPGRVSRKYTGLAFADAFDALVALALRCSGVRRFACAFPPFLPGKIFSPVCSARGVITFSHCLCVPLIISTQLGNITFFCSAVLARTVGVNRPRPKTRRATVSLFTIEPQPAVSVSLYAQEATAKSKQSRSLSAQYLAG